MVIICERCFEILDRAERGAFIRLGHIVDVRPSGEPVYVWSYLHGYDAVTGGCVGEMPAAA